MLEVGSHTPAIGEGDIMTRSRIGRARTTVGWAIILVLSLALGPHSAAAAGTAPTQAAATIPLGNGTASATGPIQIDSAAYGFSTGTATTFNWNQNVVAGGPNTLIVVGLVVRTASANAATFSVSDNATALTSVGTGTFSTAIASADNTLRAEMFAGINAPRGPNDLTVSNPAGGTAIACSVAFSGVDGSTPIAVSGADNAYTSGGPPADLIGLSSPSAVSGQVFTSVFAEPYTTTAVGAGAGQTSYCQRAFGSTTPSLITYADTHYISPSDSGEIWRGDGNQPLVVLAGMVINPQQANPTAARISRFSVRRSVGHTVFIWHAASHAGIAGFSVYATGRRVNRQLVRVRPNGLYRLVIDRSVPGPYTLRVVMANGRYHELGVG